MNKLTSLIRSFAAILLIALFSACSKDDNKPAQQITLEGIWKIELETRFLESTTEETDTQEGLEQTTGAEAEPVDITYPTVNKLQPYISFLKGNFSYYVNNESDESNVTSLIYSEGTYSVNGNTIIFTDKEGEITNGTFTINTKLTLNLTENEITKIVAVKISSEETDPDDPDNKDPDDEEKTGCATAHHTDLEIGQKLNPKILVLGEIVSDTLLVIDDGFLKRFYIEVKAETTYEIEISEISTAENNVLEMFKYVDVVVTDEPFTENAIYNKRIETTKGTVSKAFEVMPFTECLYIQLSSYQKGVKYKIAITTKENSK